MIKLQMRVHWTLSHQLRAYEQKSYPVPVVPAYDCALATIDRPRDIAYRSTMEQRRSMSL